MKNNKQKHFDSSLPFFESSHFRDSLNRKCTNYGLNPNKTLEKIKNRKPTHIIFDARGIKCVYEIAEYKITIPLIYKYDEYEMVTFLIERK